MKLFYSGLIICLILMLFEAPLFAQNNQPEYGNDTLNTAILNDYNKRLAEIEHKRLIDSIKRDELEAQLLSLKKTDNLKKADLLDQIQELNDKEVKRIAQKKAQIDSMRHSAKAYPVKGFFSDTLFLIYSRLGSFSAKDRAEAISHRIKNLIDQFGFNPDSLKLEETESTVDLLIDETIIMSITENDAIWNNTTKKELARTYQKIISDAISNYKAQTSFSTLVKEIALALLVLLIIFVLIFYLRKLFKWTETQIQLQEDKRIKGIKIKNYSLYDAKRQIRVIISLNRAFKWFCIALTIYFAIPIFLGIFPWTRNLAERLLSYILNPLEKIVLALWNFLPSLITIIVIILAFRYALKGISFLKDEVEKGNLELPGFFPEWANPTYQIVRILIFAFMIVVIFPYLPGSDSQIFKGVSVFLGFLFTFASAGSLSNIIAGIVLTYMRLFKIGDHVKLGEIEGEVIEKSLLVTRIRTIKNEIISIPNSTVMSNHTINYSIEAKEKGLIIHTTVTIGYSVPWRDMHQAMIDAALRTEMILQEPKPYVLQTQLSDFYISYQINAFIREANRQAVIYSDLHRNIQDVCNERGIEIMSPHYRAIRDGNMTSIPAKYSKKE